MFVKINGKDHPCKPEMTVRSLLEELGHDPQRVAVEKNGQIVPRACFADEALCDADTVEIVQFVGGG
ncbi:MAG TPA: sulfur carrier protein ThiS [Candidatus Agathobaculum pullistercoris]|nr:sulfur carrier protein ThiS [uncultured Agathobaculum sp.]HIX11765.1 sulfur carrier protein ThiS [Candidatus Agathobaculum pullistercoris]